MGTGQSIATHPPHPGRMFSHNMRKTDGTPSWCNHLHRLPVSYPMPISVCGYVSDHVVPPPNYCPFTPLQPLVGRSQYIQATVCREPNALSPGPPTRRVFHCLYISCRTLISTCCGCLETAYLCRGCRISPFLRPDIDFTAQGARPSTRKVR